MGIAPVLASAELSRLGLSWYRCGQCQNIKSTKKTAQEPGIDHDNDGMRERTMKAFVLMPFDAELQAVYSGFIAEVLADTGFVVFRADDLLNQRNILNDVVESIATSDLIVADLTGSNPNVYYELGIAHALDKPTILIAQDLDEVPFDLQSYRVISYGTHFAEMARAKVDLKRLLAQAVEGSLKFGSPVSDSKATVKRSSLLLTDADKKSAASPESLDSEIDADSEPGFMDHLVDMEEGFSELTELATTIASETQRIGSTTAEIGEALQASNRNPSQGSASYRRKLVRKLARELDSYGSTLAETNITYRSSLNKAANSLEAILRSELQQSDEQALRDFLVSIDSMEKGTRTARQSMQGMLNAMSGLGSIERNFNRAKEVAIRELGGLVENLDQTIAMASRTIENGQKALERLEEAGGDSAEPSTGTGG
jgi:nucleoside 2-deoxyribosyltransferase